MSAMVSLQWACEQVVIEILSTNPTLYLLNPVHEDVDSDTLLRRIVINAETATQYASNRINSSKDVRQVPMKAKLLTSLAGDQILNVNTYYAMLCQAIETMGLAPGSMTVPSLQYFLYLTPMPDVQNERERTDSRRNFSKSFSFLATPNPVLVTS